MHCSLFEEKLLQACEKVGELFFKAGDPTNGWMYLQPVADSDRARELLSAIGDDSFGQSSGSYRIEASGEGRTAAWVALARLLMNLDEFITRE